MYYLRISPPQPEENTNEVGIRITPNLPDGYLIATDGSYLVQPASHKAHKVFRGSNAFAIPFHILDEEIDSFFEACGKYGLWIKTI